MVLIVSHVSAGAKQVVCQCVTHRGVAWGRAIWWALLKLLNILAQPVGVRVTAAGRVGEEGWIGRAEDGGNR